MTETQLGGTEVSGSSEKGVLPSRGMGQEFTVKGKGLWGKAPSVFKLTARADRPVLGSRRGS